MSHTSSVMKDWGIKQDPNVVIPIPAKKRSLSRSQATDDANAEYVRRSEDSEAPIVRRRSRTQTHLEGVSTPSTMMRPFSPPSSKIQSSQSDFNLSDKCDGTEAKKKVKPIKPKFLHRFRTTTLIPSPDSYRKSRRVLSDEPEGDLEQAEAIRSRIERLKEVCVVLRHVELN